MTTTYRSSKTDADTSLTSRIKGWLIVSGLTLLASCSPNASEDLGDLEQRFDKSFLEVTKEVVKIETFRDETPEGEKKAIENIGKIRSIFDSRVAEVNGQLSHLQIEPFEWKKTVKGKELWVFGYRVGSGKRKFSVLTHLDTVPPGGDWKPFEPRIEEKPYGDGSQKFLIGRGVIDDKGPAVISLITLETAAVRFDKNSENLSDWTIEVSFDTSEETGVSTTSYIEDVGSPELGIVFDAFWSVRAEKGVESPTFSLPVRESIKNGLWIDTFETPPGPANQIPSTALARIASSDSARLAEFLKNVKALYDQCPFDDPNYRRAPLKVEFVDGKIELTTSVQGAQHGSAPEANRRDGANPLVSLANFLSGLVDDGTLDGANECGMMAKFMTWGWGTQVFGEKHPEILKRDDDVFLPGNGTTYALTRVSRSKGGITLEVDVRYAQGHHETQWDGHTSGSLKGVSRFPTLLPELVNQFNQEVPGAGLSFKTKFKAAPDIRDPNSEPYQKLDRAFAKVLGHKCPRFAVGGGTDAKSFPALIAAGALFLDEFGEPINYHGINEGAPLDDLRLSAKILYQLMLDVVEGD